MKTSYDRNHNKLEHHIIKLHLHEAMRRSSLLWLRS